MRGCAHLFVLLVSAVAGLAACEERVPGPAAESRLGAESADPGAIVFDALWGAAPEPDYPFAGLGPVYSRASCAGCHTGAGRGRPPASPDHPMLTMVVFLGHVDATGAAGPHPAYGRELSPLSIPGVPREGFAALDFEATFGAYGDGTPYTLWRPRLEFRDLAFGPLGDGAMRSPRIAQPLFGTGALARVPDAVLLAREDADDRDGDGISGRLNRVPGEGGAPAIGRFGWKAAQPSLRLQNAIAFHGDMGITTPLFPEPNCPPVQRACAAAARTVPAPNASAAILDDVTAFVAALPAPRPTDAATAGKGASLFADAGCGACHMPSLPDGAGGRIAAYTDLLLHDMGPGLADGFREGEADGQEWRTAPLWGIGAAERQGVAAFYLHDGRARTLAEAILWHGGEAAAARDRFRAMTAADRAALVAFLRGL